MTQRNLLITDRPSAPFTNMPLPVYNQDLTNSSQYAHGEFQTVVARHHIIPSERITELWNAAVLHGHLNRSIVRHIDCIRSAVANLNIDIPQCDREQAINLLENIANGLIAHDETAGHPDGFDNLVALFIWFPVNLFIGPKVRCDDPGAAFESGAGQIVSALTLRRLIDIDSDMQGYIRDPSQNGYRISMIIDSYAYLPQVLVPWNLRHDDWRRDEKKNKYYIANSA